jgi:hypothetical protein
MQRENFYILLNLSVEHPETDPKKIEQIIKKKQSEWSRMRNHPSKGIQAQQNIGMIAEIRKVMLTPQLREKEADEARKILREKKKKQYSGIDRHLDIRMSKGFITDEEVKKLAQHHHISEAEIYQRLQKKETQRYEEIDKHIRMQMKKGYITENEISKLSKIHNLDEAIVRRRIKGPIKNTGAVKVTAKPLDQSIEKVIQDNLRVIGKSSLYDFLGLPPDASIEQLYQTAKNKEATVLQIRKKNAVASASGILAGQCISIFKNEKGRASYDATLSRVPLEELKADIEVAGMDGTIRAEYFNILVKRGIDLGMDPDEASNYIQKYCKHRNWEIEKATKLKQKKKKITKPVVYTSVLLVIILISGGFFGFQWFKERESKSDYENLMALAETMNTPEEKIQVYQQYLASSKQNKYSGKILNEINKARNETQKKHYQEIVKNARDFMEKGDLNNAMDTYHKYVDQYPGSPFTDKVKKEINTLSKRIEDKDYKKLNQISSQSIDQKIAAYNHYLQKHPNGRHYESVIRLVSDLKDAYYTALNDELHNCYQQNNFKKCIDLTEKFIDVYPQDPRSKELEQLQHHYREKYLEQMVLSDLRKRAHQKNNDLEAAKQIYLNYLKLNPNSPINSKIQQEIASLENQIQAKALQTERTKRIAMIKGTNGRFVFNGKEDVITDTRTGLMWTLWDSKKTNVDCMDYETALTYVKSLKAGGYQDWRLPAAQELIRIYASPHPFPFTESPWYWTSENYKSYQGEWVCWVNVVIAQKKINTRIEQKDSRECGAVRAVRP